AERPESAGIRRPRLPRPSADRASDPPRAEDEGGVPQYQGKGAVGPAVPDRSVRHSRTYRPDVGQECPTHQSGLVLFDALGVPIAGLADGVAVAGGLNLALDRVAVDLAVVLGDHLGAVALAGGGEAEHTILEAGILDLGLGVV